MAIEPIGAGLDETLWGPEPSPGEVRQARAIADESARRARLAALDGALSTEETADRVGSSVAEVEERIGLAELVVLDDGEAVRLPAWQFTARGTLRGLREVIAAYPGSALSLSVWASRPAADLGGRTPAEHLRGGGSVRQVLDHLAALRHDR